ncbi:MAG: 4Fe-4S binding protein [Acidaminococcus sp.]|jgi:uncharacterized pyridoxamine 5'-phosphate oxidase family protein/Pyruvate/2-oxoacid:ferredoxin oxidoreductase delta subunit|nr:4Fe-4S binding protein [Acidaminococcus sp.]MCI2099762.1 4Fe-4S binding protein [Acidaminococcus sp.]MCI2113968.1 4Fe-4S binding protein [Acidaminococcus sp.]MCI2117075.1 4Fe-4S binding protein [Acidaminococcus sp.]
MQSAGRYLSILANDIHSVVCATVDEKGLPVTRAMDVMLADDHTFYFLTAKGKAFYDQLMRSKFIALTGMKGGEGLDRAHATMHTKAISVRGFIECIGSEKLDEIFDANPYMAEIYPQEEARKALVVFRMVKGEGEYFDLSTKPITRESFGIGDLAESDAESHVKEPYFITDACIGCGKCLAVCPQQCIEHDSVPFRIDQRHCLHCGNCYTDCPVKAIIRR